MSLTRKVTSSVVWLALAQGAQRIGGLVITAVLARLLVPADFGLIALTVVAIGLFKIFTEVGLNTALVQRKELQDEHLTSAFWLTLFLSVLLTSAGLLTAPVIARIYREPRLLPLLIVMMLSVPITNIGQVSDALLQRRLAFRQLAIIDWASSLAAGLIGIGLALARAGVWALVAQNLTLVTMSAVLKIIAAGWLPSLKFQFKYARAMMTFSVAIVGCTLINYAAFNIDNALVGSALGAQALGYYALAFNLVMLPGGSIGGLVTRVMFPALSSIQTDLPRFRRGYLRMLRVISSISLPAIVGLGTSAPILIATVYGEQWTQAIPVLQVLMFVGVLQALNTSGLIFYALGRPNLLLAWAALSLACMSISFAIGVRWGLMGVTWAYVLASPIVWIGPHLLANRMIALPNKSLLFAIGPSLCAATIMGLGVRYFVGYRFLHSNWSNLAVLIALGVVFYGGSYALIGMVLGRREGGLIAWLSGRHSFESSSQLRVTT
jgi:PST family polysaccharide transporter